MSQDFANQPMLEGPEVMHANAGHGKALGQVRAHCFDPLAQTGTELKEERTVRRYHALPRRRHHTLSVPVRQDSLTASVEKAFIGRYQPRKALDQVGQQAKVMRSGRQQGTAGDHPAAGNPQAQFEAIVVQLLGGPMPVGQTA